MPMQTRTDQVHSYEFFLQRVVSGLVARESDPAELPFRRLGWSAFGSVMLAVVVSGVVAIVGLVVGGGNDSWRNGDSIIQEKGSEAFYVYREPRLHPVANLVSAQLIMNGAEVVRVSGRSLSGVPRGATLGIVGAPQSLPEGPDGLVTAAWTLCSQQQPDDTGGVDTVSVLGVGEDPADGAEVGEQAVLVDDVARDTRYMVWRGHRYLVDPEVERAVLLALGVGETSAVPVEQAWVDGLPEGDRLEAPPSDPPGEASTAIPGAELVTGDVIQDGDRYYLVRRDGLDEITELEATILIRMDDDLELRPVRIPTDVEPTPLPPLADASLPREGVPEFVSALALDGSVCARFEPGGFTPTVLAGGELDPANATPRVSEEGTGLADYVVMEGGAAVLVRSLSAPDAPGGAWHIVNDQGTRYSLPSGDVAAAFGYATDRGVSMSGGLVDLLPDGPPLDPAAAEEPIPLTAVDDP